jgi:endoglucanase
MRALMKPLVIALAILSGSAFSAAALTFKRGISMEQWTTWPAESEWGKPEVMFPFPEWRRNVTPEALADLKSQGLDFVRLPVDPGVFMAKNAETLRDRLFAEIDQTIAELRDAGLNVIVDLHSIPGGESRTGSVESLTADDAAFARYTALAVEFAARLAGREGVALEPINEPVLDCEPGENRWPAMLSSMHAALRKSAPDLPLVIQAACWGGIEKLAALPEAVTADPLVIVSFHSYAPFILTHQAASWTGDVMPHVTGLPFPPDRFGANDLETAMEGIRERVRAKAEAGRINGIIAWVDEQMALIDTPEKLAAAMRDPFIRAERFAKDRGIAPERMLLGEFGMIRQEWGSDAVIAAASRIEYLREMRKLAEEHGFGWAIWGYSGAFGVVQSFGGEILLDDIIRRTLDAR